MPQRAEYYARQDRSWFSHERLSRARVSLIMMLPLAAAAISLLTLLPLGPTVRGRAAPSSRFAVRPLCLEGSEADDVATAATLLTNPRPISGPDAFSETAWQVLIKMDVGGTAMFTVEFLKDKRCRFSDTELFGALLTLASS